MSKAPTRMISALATILSLTAFKCCFQFNLRRYTAVAGEAAGVDAEQALFVAGMAGQTPLRAIIPTLW